MENPANDLIVNSKGHCFFCLSKISFRSTPVKLKGDLSSSLHQLHYLSQYLGMDLTKVFNQKGSIPPSLLAKVEQSRLKAELCEDCSKLSNSISVLCKRMEKLRMEIDFKLSHLQDKLVNADESGRSDEFRRFGRLGEDEGLIEVLEVLRTEAREKCSNRSNLAPRVKVQNLTRKVVKASSRIRNETKPSSKAGLGLQSDNQVKMEDRNDESVLEDNGGNGFMDDMGGISDDDSRSNSGQIGSTAIAMTRTTSAYENVKDATCNVSKSGTDKPKYTINPQTGKYKCNLCSKDFGQVAFHYHYKSVHLRIRYKCNLCEKVFTQKSAYNLHLQSVHLGIRYKCLVCHKQFTYKTRLAVHQRNNVCKTGEERAN